MALAGFLYTHPPLCPTTNSLAQGEIRSPMTTQKRRGGGHLIPTTHLYPHPHTTYIEHTAGTYRKRPPQLNLQGQHKLSGTKRKRTATPKDNGTPPSPHDLQSNLLSVATQSVHLRSRL